MNTNKNVFYYMVIALMGMQCMDFTSIIAGKKQAVARHKSHESTCCKKEFRPYRPCDAVKKSACVDCSCCKKSGSVCAEVENIFNLELSSDIYGNSNAITALRTVCLPGNSQESMLIAEQRGIIWNVNLATKVTTQLLDITALTTNPAFSEMGLTAIEPDPCFHINGLLYISYALADSGGEPVEIITPSPCFPETLTQEWQYTTSWDHTNVIEAWKYNSGFQTFEKIERYLEVKSVQTNHQGIDNLRWDNEKNGLVYTLGDTESNFVRRDAITVPVFNLAQQDEFMQGKQILLNVHNWPYVAASDQYAVAKFSELPMSVQSRVKLLNKGIRNGNSPVAEHCNDRWIRYQSIQGEETLEAIFAYDAYCKNFGWRPIEGGTLESTFRLNACPEPEEDRRIYPPFFTEDLQATNLWNIVHRPVESVFNNTSDYTVSQIGAIPYKGTKLPHLKNAVITAWYDSRKIDLSGRFPEQIVSSGTLRYFCPDRNCLQQRVNNYNIVLKGFTPVQPVEEGTILENTAIGANKDLTEIYFASRTSLDGGIPYPPFALNKFLSVWHLKPAS